ncbi:MAG: Xaa-Pro dipeptidase [Oceanospirillales bacterium LUC14_002_19_P2]|nr:MAG: Xaa-Pro dipeptidase [Oceanospirillales bacterium LUC14_002_19_P2]
MTDWTSLFARHVATLVERYTEGLALAGYHGVLIPAGSPDRRFQDDQDYPFWGSPFFRQWVPSRGAPESMLIFVPGETAQLVHYQPRDYWHVAPEPAEAFWANALDIKVIDSPDQLRDCLPQDLSSFALLGYEDDRFSSWGLGAVNPPELMHYLIWMRAYKTPYEQACMREANRIAAHAHQAAADAFHEGLSEFDIHLRYLAASRHRECELPYGNIVALNEHGAVLHYDDYDREPPAERRAFLIDAGASFRNYHADITRTYAAGKGDFADMVERMNTEQLGIIDEIQMGMSYGALHDAMHRRIAGMLSDFDIVRLPAEAVYDRGYSRTFFPHGLGHLIGLQTHDVGGWLTDPDGPQVGRHPDYPALRLQRTIETDMLFTIEPGLYFIDQLLGEHEGNADFNWPRIESLKPFGGIRIEDTVLVKDGDTENFTRPFLTSKH